MTLDTEYFLRSAPEEDKVRANYYDRNDANAKPVIFAGE